MSSAGRAAADIAATKAQAQEVALALCCADPAATVALGRRLGSLLRGGDCVALSGALGAGKTTLAQGIVAGLGSLDRATSPTFTLVNEYGAPGLTIYHVDLYRLAEGAGALALEAATLGLDDAIGAPDAVVLVEWASLFPAFLPPDHLRVALEAAGDGRLAHLTAPPGAARAQTVLAALAATT